MFLKREVEQEDDADPSDSNHQAGFNGAFTLLQDTCRFYEIPAPFFSTDQLWIGHHRWVKLQKLLNFFNKLILANLDYSG